MALIKCPYCDSEVSDTTKACPNCGFKIAKQFGSQIPPQPTYQATPQYQQHQQTAPQKKKGKGCLWVMIAFWVIVAILIRIGTSVHNANSNIDSSISTTGNKVDIDPLQSCAELTDEELANVKTVLTECEINYLNAEYDKTLNDLIDEGVWGYRLKTAKANNILLFLSKVDNSVVRVRYADEDLWCDGGFKNTLEYIINRPDLELIGDTSGTNDGFAIYIEGTVRNNSNKKYSYVQITFGIYDANGNKVGTALGNLLNLGAGETWKFKAMSTSAPSNGTYKLEEITGH